MPKDDRDDLADALAKLASGDIAPSEHAPSNPLSDDKTPVDPNEVAPPPLPSAQVARPSPKPRPVPGKAAARPQRPTTPAPRPAAPSSSSWVPSSGEATPPPAAPDDSLAAATVDLGLQEPSEQSVILDDDDDAVIVPAPDAAVFAPKHIGRGSHRRSALYQTIEFRRTIIPVLLTCGVLTIAFGMLKYALGEDSPLSELPGWLPIVLFITGALLLTLAVTNMLSVHHHLGEHPK
jgi:hypothetical protein